MSSESIIDSSILTGELYGGLASGATEVISGKIKKDQKKVDEGIEDIKESGGAIVGNIIINTKNVIDNSGEVVSGIKHKDGRKILRGVKSLAKYAAVSTITVGSMKIKQSDDPDIKQKQSENYSHDVKQKQSENDSPDVKQKQHENDDLDID